MKEAGAAAAVAAEVDTMVLVSGVLWIDVGWVSRLELAAQTEKKTVLFLLLGPCSGSWTEKLKFSTQDKPILSTLFFGLINDYKAHSC